MPMSNNLGKRIRCCLFYFVLSVIVLFPVTPFDYFTTVNAEAAVLVQKPISSLKGGRYLDTQTVKLTCKTKGAVIYYTTNGRTPNAKSIKYSRSIIVKKNSIIRAVAIKNGVKSKEFIATYKIYDYTDFVNDVERFQKAIENDRINRLPEQEQAVCNTIKDAINTIITDEMTDYDKIKAIHDYIINNCTYYKYKEVYEDVSDIPSIYFTIEGTVINHSAVCQGYAETFQLFMNILGIENKLIYGNGIESGGESISHVWNLVKLNNNWYHVDTTWDDPTTNSNIELLSYKYFLINDFQMFLDHVWPTSNYPSCTKDDLMYKVYEGHIINTVKNYSDKFIEFYNQGYKIITILYPENQKPELGFYWSLTGKDHCTYSGPDKFGDYYIFNVYLQ
jgi:hypothetical protein